MEWLGNSVRSGRRFECEYATPITTMFRMLVKSRGSDALLPASGTRKRRTRFATAVFWGFQSSFDRQSPHLTPSTSF